jgi:hypothetical protein
MNEHYAAVLADLRARRERIEAELRDVDAAISGLQRLLGGEQAFLQVGSNRPIILRDPFNEPPSYARYANISVRWGVLWHLSEHSTEFEKTAQITDALESGGYKSSGASRFGNMVSAVLSNMKAKGEVETNDDGGYRITETGRKTWNLIRQGAKFREAISSSNEQLPLS